MTEVTVRDLFAAYCKLHGRWGLLLSFEPAECEVGDRELVAACPVYASLGVDAKCDGRAFLFFETERQARLEYSRTVGDDGPTPNNPYNGPAKVYALLCDEIGSLVAENT